MLFETNIMEAAKRGMDSKSTVKRIKHSKLFHSTRSAMSGGGSFASKGLKVIKHIGKAALGLVPIPVIAPLVGGVIDMIDSAGREHMHGKRLNSAPDIDTQTKTKFTLKELKVDDLDRYRWKISDAHQELKKATDAFNAKQSGNDLNCDDFFEVAKAYAQFNRRTHKMKMEITALSAVVALTARWIAELETGAQVVAKQPTDYHPPQPSKGIFQDQRNFLKTFLEWVENQKKGVVDVNHTQCSEWCVARTNPNVPIDNSRLNMVGHAVGMLLTLGYSACITFKGSDYEVEK